MCIRDRSCRLLQPSPRSEACSVARWTHPCEETPRLSCYRYHRHRCKCTLIIEVEGHGLDVRRRVRKTTEGSAEHFWRTESTHLQGSSDGDETRKERRSTRHVVATEQRSGHQSLRKRPLRTRTQYRLQLFVVLQVCKAGRTEDHHQRSDPHRHLSHVRHRCYEK